ncbi:class I SAM-dependent RNA methyltransferase [Aestuariivita sp.]|jgi:putative N6-adenine-specific DNA methylase|uniref:THUMP domain-containing class I SAM-dependent RNA methyltransferase n=1 Tax=Aestuariivita sp. TaxID=1872407 RepID=UPI002173EAC4|nr:class I SAM-dependent RNA methyltransferase [Aestuariivita sp.]MCE8007404.1 class I SAM-dependent RNA methyltransferase [Aestuariivita sp.]
MSLSDPFDIFLTAPPGLEEVLQAEVTQAGFADPVVSPGGVTIRGGWPEVWRANLVLRGAGRVLARFGGFPVFHLAQLDKRARKFGWGEVLRPEVPVRVEVTCKRSKIYHAGAARQRIETALSESFGAQIAQDAPLRIKARIEDNYCTFSVDTSGESLHKRGHKEAVGKAPMRETLAALFLRQCGYVGDEPVVDPMCGSGTFVIEAAEIAQGLYPGRSRGFAFEQLARFDPDRWQDMRQADVPSVTALRFCGFDRDQGAIGMSAANADRAGIGHLCRFTCQPISALTRPDGPPGLVIVNPPYGARIGNKKLLYGLYGALGDVLKSRFSGWRAGVVTSEAGLARATGLQFKPPGPPVPLGGLKIRLFQTERL